MLLSIIKKDGSNKEINLSQLTKKIISDKEVKEIIYKSSTDKNIIYNNYIRYDTDFNRLGLSINKKENNIMLSVKTLKRLKELILSDNW